MNEGLVDDGQRNFRSGRVCLDDIFTLKQIGEKAQEKKRRVYMDFMDPEKAYDRVNKKAPWQILRMHDVSGKLLSGIKGTCINNLVSVRVKGGESKCF